MVGIVLIIILGFILLRYVPRKFEGENRFQQSLFWAKIGAGCFIGQIIWMLAIGHFSLALSLNWLYGSPLQGFMAYITNYSFFPFDVISSFPINMSLITMFTFLIPIISVGLTHVELVKPLSERKAPNQHWFHLIGMVAVTCVGAFYCQSLSYATASSIQILPVVLFYFSILLFGIFAVEKSWQELNSARL